MRSSSTFDWDSYDALLEVGRTLRRRQRNSGGFLALSHEQVPWGQWRTRGRTIEQINPSGVLAFVRHGPGLHTPRISAPRGESQPSTPDSPRVASAAIVPITQEPIAKRGPRVGESTDEWHQRLRDAAAAAV